MKILGGIIMKKSDSKKDYWHSIPVGSRGWLPHGTDPCNENGPGVKKTAIGKYVFDCPEHPEFNGSDVPENKLPNINWH